MVTTKIQSNLYNVESGYSPYPKYEIVIMQRGLKNLPVLNKKGSPDTKICIKIVNQY